MAKGNLFQGMARGKIGDVVFYRMNGVQMSRIRNRAPKNPRTNEQLYQRAIIATTMKIYSAGKEIFDHAFQGYTVGEGCMRRFNSVNARILRAGLISDLYKADKDCQFRFVAPRSLYPVASSGIQISEGTLQNKLLEAKALEETDNWFIHWADNTEGATTVKDYLAMKGTYEGDIYTIIIFYPQNGNIVYKPEWTNSAYAQQNATYFQYIRLIIKQNIADTLTLENAKIEDVFEIELGGDTTGFNGAQIIKPGSPISLSYKNGFNRGAIGVIRSRLDEDLRSTSFLHPLGAQDYGITAPYVLQIWQNEVEKIGTSELILEGGTEGGAVPASLEGLHPVPLVNGPENENPVPRMARHKGTRNNKKG